MLWCFVALGLGVFSTLFILTSGVDEEIEESAKSIEKERDNQNSTQEDLSSFRNLDRDYELCRRELQNLANIEKKQTIFWKNLLNARENHLLKWSEKSPESVNADITRLFTTLRSRCQSAKIELPSNTSKTPTIGFGDTNKRPANNYGFGFSSYDGFWPSFTREEAKTIGVQAKIIKELVEYLTQSVTETQNLTLVEILREPAGAIDLKHVGDSRIVLGPEKILLLRDANRISSLVFQLSIKGQSVHARTFINQLKPPFMLRNLSVKRELAEPVPAPPQQEFIPNPFGPSSSAPQPEKSEALPVVKEVYSEFTFLIEYVTQVNFGIENLLEDENFWQNADAEILEEFLTASGNTERVDEAKKMISDGKKN